MSKDSERFQVRPGGGVAAPGDARVSVLTAAAMRVHPHRRSTGPPGYAGVVTNLLSA